MGTDEVRGGAAFPLLPVITVIMMWPPSAAVLGHE